VAGLPASDREPRRHYVSAGGGVALRLLTKAGPRQLLNELSKMSPIAQGTCAVTSAGNLPVHYILHAAPLRICPDGSYDISAEHIETAVAHALRVAEALQVGAVWIPLLGAGVADMPPADSLTTILRVVARCETCLMKRWITIVIYEESILGRDAVRAIVKQTLPRHYSIVEV
jgi:O-acetyl-ADP-ribose deacetylase (regulator of RNase III)